MKKQMKRMLAVLFISFLLVGELESYTVAAKELKEPKVQDTVSAEKVVDAKMDSVVKGVGNREVESNGSFATANPIALNTTYYGVGDEIYDVDYYKITLPNDGVVSVTFNHALQDYDNDNFDVSIQSLDKTYTSITSSGHNTSISTNKVGLAKGTYYVVVNCHYRSGAGLEYNFKVDYAASNVWEKEENDAFSQANPIAVNTTYYGVGDEIYDEDYYKVTLPNDGVVSVTFNHALQDYDNNNFDVSIQSLDKTYDSITSTGYDTSISTNKVGLAKGTYYIVVNCRYRSGADLEYNFNVNYAASNAWEKEMNDAFSQANPIALNKTYYGNFVGSNDEDYYSFSLNKKTWLNYYFEHSKYTDCGDTDGFDIALYNSSGKKLERDTSGFKLGTLTSDATVKYTSWTAFQLKPGRYYIVVNNHNSFDKDLEGKEYKFTLEKVETKAPKIKTAKSAGYNAAKLTWTKVRGAEGYYIERSTSKNGRYTTVGHVNPVSTSYTDRRLTCGKKYYYKITAVTYKGKIKYNSSKPKMIKPVPASTTVSLSSNRNKQIKVSWKKVKGANGYVIYRSTSPNGKYKRVKVISRGSTRSYVNKKLKSSTTYYYKVRAYKKVKGKKIYGTNSVAVGIRCK